MGSISKKLKSERGVTILLALLLFLVCAVTGSVVITAGTAASGTISERAKLDQRYFSVTSAAELLRNKFDGISVRVTVPADFSESNSLTVNDGPSNVSVNYSGTVIEPLNGLKPEEELVIVSSLWLLGEMDALPKIDNEKLDSYTLEAASNDPETNDKLKILKINVNVDSQKSGSIFTGLTFQLENANADDEKKFRLQMDYSASVVQEYGNTYRVDWQMNKVSLGD